ncbi:STAS-like domain-containing protein [Metabacillus litoralis]|uniref:STAS-like domain-containing protein n=1 Tax=Metabacillus TaxID=2675233 RepID=UPI001B98AA3D|nr:STAS-like domain-containing protein [Metabacillus litoralis]MCM3164545.1 STAS-like domain-containing protein [Metabacillus litoralis]
MLIIIKNIIGTNFAVSPENGDKVYENIKSRLINDLDTVVSFEGLEQITTAFLNNAIAKLYNDFNPEKLNQFLKITDLDTYDLYLLKKVIERAKLNIEERNIKGEFGSE